MPHPKLLPWYILLVRQIPLTSSYLRRIIAPLLLLIFWQVGSTCGFIPSRTFAPPTQVAAAFWHLAASGELEHHLLVSLGRASAGLSIALAIGGSLALLAGLSKRGEDFIDPTVQMLRTLPFLALVPLFILWFGIGETPKIALVALGASFPIYLTLFAGIRGVDPKLIELARTLGLSSKDRIRQIILPGALASALVGVRYSCGIAWLSLVVAEQINAQSGIGYLIMNARDFMATDVIVVGLLVYALLGLASDRLVRFV